MRLTGLPIAVKIPLVVIVFMAAVAVFLSERVLARLTAIQTGHLEALATVYLDGLESALAQPVVREDVWEVYDILDRARRNHGGLRPIETIVTTTGGEVLASSDPRSTPSLSPLPASFPTGRSGMPKLVVQEPGGKAFARRDLAAGETRIGSIHAAFDIAPLLAERRSVLVALVGTNALLTLALALAAWLTVRRMMRPVHTLGRHLEAGASGPVAPIPTMTVLSAGAEFKRLFTAFNAMGDAVSDRAVLAQRLADEERLASLGRLASGMAHEINNPLGGLFNAIDTLKEHGERPDVRRRTIDLIERGLHGIRDVVRTALVTYRADRDDRELTPADIDDLQLLIGPETQRKNLTLHWSNGVAGPVPIRVSPVRQSLLNLLLNACHATPPGGDVAFTSVLERDRLVARVEDSGPGMSEAARGILAGTIERLGPSHSVGRQGTGLGLWMVRRLVREAGGMVTAMPREGGGTVVQIIIPFAHHEEALAHVA